MAKFVEVTRGNVVWLGVRFNGQTRLLYPSHVVGDCRRPGQRLDRVRARVRGICA